MARATLTLEELRRILAEDGPKAALERAQRDFLPSRFLPKLVEQAGDDHPALALFLAAYPETPTKDLETLADKVTLPEVLAALARHPRASKSVMTRLAKEAPPVVREVLARHKQIMPSIADLLAEDEAISVRCALAENPALAKATQVRLAADPVPLVRLALLAQKHLDRDALQSLATDADVLVKAACIMDADVPPEQLLEWADTDEFFTQLFLLRRENLPDNALESLCFSDHAAVQERAVARRKLSLDEMLGWSEKGTVAVRRCIAAKADLPPEIQEILARDTDAQVHRILAANPAILEKLAMRMAQGDDLETWYALAGNPGITPKVLLELCTIREPLLQRMLAGRQDLQSEHVVELVADGMDESVLYHLAVNGVSHPGLPGAQAERLAVSVLPALRAFAASSEQLTRTQMQRLAMDAAPQVRARLVANQSTSEPVLRFLLTDSDPAVAAAAKTRLEALQAQRQAQSDAVDTDGAPAADDAPAPGLGLVIRHVLRKSGRAKK